MNIELPAQFEKIQELVDSKDTRERVLIFISVFAIVFMLWNFSIQRIFDQKVSTAQQSLQKIQQETLKTQNELAQEVLQLSNDPNKEKKERVAQLKKEIAQVDTQLQQLGNRLIKAEQLPGALQEALLKTTRVNLLNVGTFPAKELILSGLSITAPSVDASAGDQTAGVYQHLVEIKVSGSFAEIYQLVLSLEQLPWRFYWQSLDYKVKQYPEAEVILRVYTLSAEEGLLGV